MESYWQYQWSPASASSETFGPFDSQMMSSWAQAELFITNPARVRLCNAAGQPLGQEWQPADQTVFMPGDVVAATAKVTEDGLISRLLKTTDSKGPVDETSLGLAGPLVTREVACSARDAGFLTKLWWELSRPRKRGKIPKVQGKHVWGDSQSLMPQWLSARQVDGSLVQEKDQQDFQVFRFAQNTLTPAQENWDQAFHGTRWYALWLILTSGVMLASDNKEAGHDFWEPGVYCTPVLGTARWYGIPHILFGDDIYHRVVIELRVDPARRKKNRQRGGVQWVFPADATVIRAIWIQNNSPPDSDERRFAHWDPEMEALPPGRSQLPPIVNPRRPISHIREDYSWYEAEKLKMIETTLNIVKIAARPPAGAPSRPSPPAVTSSLTSLLGVGAQPLLPTNGSLANGLHASPAVTQNGMFQNLKNAAMDKLAEQKKAAMAFTMPEQAAPGSLQALLAGSFSSPEQPEVGQLAPEDLQAQAEAEAQAERQRRVLLAQNTRPARPMPPQPIGANDMKRKATMMQFAAMLANTHKKRL